MKSNQSLKALLRKLTSTALTWETVPLRLVLAVVFIQHGSEKVFGAFGGEGWSAWLSESQYAPLGFMRPAWLWLAAAALSEFVGGILVLLGLFTRAGAFFIACVMATAIYVVGLPALYQFSLLAMTVALVIAGGGKFSVDQLIAGRG
jgi:putative oxidoreductase